MLLKGAQEVQQAPQPQLALEMLMIRLMYVSDQPTPGDVLKQLKDGSTVSMGGAPMGSPGGGSPRPTVMSRTAAAPAALGDLDAGVQACVNGFNDVVALFAQRREAILQSQLMNFVHLVKFEQGHLSLRLKEGAPQNLVGQISNKLGEWTGQRWVVSLSREAGEPTLAEVKQSRAQTVMNDIKAHPVVAEALKAFPGAKIIDIRERK
jgi:DNA polymerase-3 subunit gamma/tau